MLDLPDTCIQNMKSKIKYIPYKTQIYITYLTDTFDKNYFYILSEKINFFLAGEFFFDALPSF